LIYFLITGRKVLVDFAEIVLECSRLINNQYRFTEVFEDA
jgi:hypothetical protein